MSINCRAVRTKYGVIQSRDALVLRDTSLNMRPLEITIRTSLLLSACDPPIESPEEVPVIFRFYDIVNLSISMIDHFPLEKYVNSSFDEVIGEYKPNSGRFILSTYDHVFDITGKYEISYL